MTVGENIKRIRKERGLTQKELGELCGINEVQVRRYEIGKANPKIETIDRIASALGVFIADIKEDITWEERKNTSEVKKLDRKVSAVQGIIAILTDIYGKVEDKDLVGEYGSGNYYLVGEGKDQFILYGGDIDTLYQSTKGAIPALVERMKDIRSEKEVIAEYLKELNTPIPPELIPDSYKP